MYLIVGGDSEIGGVATRFLERSGASVLATTRRAADVGPHRLLLDLDTLDDTWQPPSGVTAACICVAVARLAACSADPVGSSRVNCKKTIALVRKLAESGIYTLFLSTNQVFDGSCPNVAADAPHSAVSAYGQQKAVTETALMSMQQQGLAVGILRLAKVVSPGMALLADWQRDLLARRPVRAFRDMKMAPTPIKQVAEAIQCMLADRSRVIAQLTGPRDISYAAVARLVADYTGGGLDLVEDVEARHHGMPVGATPLFTSLDSSFLLNHYGIAVAPAEDVILNDVLTIPNLA